ETHEPRCHEACRRAPRAHHPRVPEPFIDALAIQSSSGSAPLLVVGFELRLQRREFGERRIRIGDFFAPLLRTLLGEGAAVAIALAVAARRTIFMRTILARGPWMTRALLLRVTRGFGG